jgi:glyoxylase-like metal-dependent hydrolase (beta-lactamase superfamily II)/rhodanese-related sulfurtransferase
MTVEQIYTGCLAQGAYYIRSGNEAAIIDPLREIKPYLERAEKDGVKIRYVLETHFHADFVSGHLDLAKATGAQIVYGPQANPGFEARIALDGEILPLGDASLQVLHTPGHTMESTCYLLRDESGKNHCIFTGDTLFLGDVGRPDLAQKAASMTQEELAGMLFDSLQTKILPLEDDLIVYPGHGAGSACGKNMMKETVDTLGNQKKLNYALRQSNRDAFIKEVTDGLLPPPGYFGLNVAMNKSGYESFEQVLSRGKKALSPDDFESEANRSEALILDTRPAEEFCRGFIPRSVNIGLKGDFAPWVGALLVDVKQELLLVCRPGEEEEAITRLSRIGFDHVIGYLQGGFDSWKSAGKEEDRVNRISAEEFAARCKKDDCRILDLRREAEYNTGHLEKAENRPLDFINDWYAQTSEPDVPLFIHCAGGYRSMIAASILKSRGFHGFFEIEGGFKAISGCGLPITASSCSSALP